MQLGAVLLAAVLAAGPATAGVKILPLEEPKSAGAGSSEEIAGVIAKLRALPPLPKGTATQGHRKALVIGNDAYEGLDRLNKAVGDARTLGATLKDLGFVVTTIENAGVERFDEALVSFYESLGEGDVALFFFSGHGVADGDNNYLLPVDMPKLTELERGKLKRNAVDASDIVAEIKGRGVRLAFIVLDACRDDPFALEDGRSAVSAGGLARMKPTEGAFVIYSAGIRQKALDRLDPADRDPNSIFTRKFSPILQTPGLPIVEIAKRTQVDVRALAATVGHVQTPAYYDQVIGQYYLRPPKPRLFGLSIGIDEYGREFETRGAVNDSERVARALEALGAVQIVPIHNRDARRSFVEFAWTTLVEKAAPGDTIVFHYAGSSAQFPQREGGTEADGREEFLLLSGSSYKELVQGGVTEDHPDIITDDVLTGWMEMAAAKNVNVTLVVDGCHGGGLLDREFANVSFIGGSAEDQVVPEVKIGGRYHGAVSESFARAIEGEADFNSDGFVTQAEMDVFVAAEVDERIGAKQTPQFMPSTTETTAALALFELPNDIAERRARVAAMPWPDEQTR
jgi:hypothetical protein